MADPGEERQWPVWVRLHVPVLLGVTGSLLAGWFEWTRALEGRQVAWVYAGEWPLFAVLGVVIWWRLWHEERALRPTRPHPSRPAPVGGAGCAAVTLAAVRSTAVTPAVEGAPHRPPERGDEVDAELLAWQDYLARLQAVDPPGGPPPRG